MVYIRQIIDRVKQITGWNQKEIASKIFDISDKNLSNKIRRGSVDTWALIRWAGNENVDLYWLFGIDKPQADQTLVESPPSDQHNPETRQLLSMASKILGSDSDMSQSLAVTIREFFTVVENRDQLTDIQEQLFNTQKMLEKASVEIQDIRTEMEAMRRENALLKSGVRIETHQCCKKDRRQRHEPVDVDRRTGHTDRRRAVNE